MGHFFTYWRDVEFDLDIFESFIWVDLVFPLDQLDVVEMELKVHKESLEEDELMVVLEDKGDVVFRPVSKIGYPEPLKTHTQPVKVLLFDLGELSGKLQVVLLVYLEVRDELDKLHPLWLALFVGCWQQRGPLRSVDVAFVSLSNPFGGSLPVKIP